MILHQFSVRLFLSLACLVLACIFTRSSVAQSLATPNISVAQYLTGPVAPKAGGTFSFEAKVSGGSGLPLGNILFVVDGQDVLTVTLDAGRATVNIPLNAGSHTITARYSGDSIYANATAETIVGIPKLLTYMNLYIAQDYLVYGANRSLVVQLSSEPRGGLPTGSVSVFIDNGLAGIMNANSQFPLPKLPPGQYEIKAIYQGTVNYEVCSGTWGYAIQKGKTTTAISTSPAAPQVGDMVTITASFTAVDPTPGPPEGLASFTVDGQPAGLGTLANGVATLKTSFAAAGAHTVAATYQGSGLFEPGSVVSAIVTVNPACSITLDSLTRGFTEAGGTAAINLTAAPGCSWNASTGDAWITITSRAPDKVVFRTDALGSGTDRTGIITLGGLRYTVFQKKTVPAVSAATFSVSDIAPDAIVSAFGAGLAEKAVSASSLPLPTSLGGVEIRIRDSQNTERYATLFYVSPDQINYKVPAGTAIGNATIGFYRDGQLIAFETLRVATHAPGIFTANQNGVGVPAANIQSNKADGSITFEDAFRYDSVQNTFVPKPISLGDGSDPTYLLLYATGVRGVTSADTVTALIGGVPAPVVYVGPQGAYDGLDQINIRLSYSLANNGIVDVKVYFNGSPVNTVQIRMQQ